MTRENKLALVVGFGLILFVGILISDHFSTVQSQEPADLAGVGVDPLLNSRRDDPDLIVYQPDHLQSSRQQRQNGNGQPLMNNGNIVGESGDNAHSPANPNNEIPDRLYMGSGDANRNSSQVVRDNSSSPRQEQTVHFHDVRSGETLTAICRRYFGSADRVMEIAQLNGMDDPDLVQVGMRLRIPVENTTESPRRQREQPTSPSNSTQQPAAQTYTVKPGDTLSQIAQQLLGTVRKTNALYEFNRDVIDDPDNLKAGVVLRIPQD